MLAKLCAGLLFLWGGSVIADDIVCPPEALPNEAERPSGIEAWCELAADRTVLHGPYRAWHPNGVLGAEEHYVRGKATGPALYRWGSGEKQAQGSYRNGIPEGWWSFWDKTGTIAGRVRYRNGAVVAGQLPKWALDWSLAPIARPLAAP